MAVKKAYVSYHLMSVYTHAEMRHGLSDGLRRRIQGESCFNFRKVDCAHFEELGQLTAAWARLYERPFEVRRGQRGSRLLFAPPPLNVEQRYQTGGIP